MIREIHAASKKIEMRLNLNKTKIISGNQKQFIVENLKIERVNDYVYLGHILKLGKQNQVVEINRRIRMAWGAFGRLGETLKNKSVPICLKRKVFENICDTSADEGNGTATTTTKKVQRN